MTIRISSKISDRLAKRHRCKPCVCRRYPSSYDTITGVIELKEVTATFVREVDHINYLTILDEFGNEQVIATTDSHPFWVVTDEPDLERAARGTVDENGVILYHENIDPGLNGFWVEAKDLREGDVFLGANGELLTLVSQERVEFEESITVYNFTVDGNHNYFVIAETDEFGQTCVLVHNTKGGKQNIRPSEIPASWSAKQIRAYLDKHGDSMTKAQKDKILSYLKTMERLEKINNINIRSWVWWTPAALIDDIIDRIFGEGHIEDGRWIFPGVENPHWSPHPPGIPYRPVY